MSFEHLLFPNFKKKALTLSYDDGVLFDKRLIEIMKKNGVRGTFNLNSGLLGSERFKPEQYKEIYLDNGMEIAVHGEKHLNLPAFSNEVVLRDIMNNRVALENITGGVVTGMAYAYGTFDDRIVNVLKTCGISYSRTVGTTGDFEINDDWLRLKATCYHNDSRLMELADRFLEEGEPFNNWRAKPKLFYVWGHSYEFDRNNNWNVIEEFCEKVGNRDDVWYATNIEIYNYVEAYKKLVFSANGKSVYNPTCIDLYIKSEDYKEVFVPAGATVQL